MEKTMTGAENVVLPISFYTDEQKKERLDKLNVGQKIQFNKVWSKIYPGAEIDFMHVHAYKDKNYI